MYKFTKIFEPIILKNVELKNRLVVSAMVTNYCEPDGFANERYIAYHEEKAKGGWGLIITEDYAIAPGVGAYSNLPGLYTDEHIASHQQLTDRVHQAGGTIVCQIYHAGRQVSFAATGVHPVGPSAIPYTAFHEVPKALSKDEIREIIGQFALTAARAKKAGFDAVEIHGAHGYLLSAFVSPLSNKRLDEYGGDIVGRSRMSVRVVEAVREAVGEDFPIIYRMSSVEYQENGLNIEEAKVLSCLLEEAGVDMLHVSQGHTLLHVALPSSHEPKAAFVNNAAEIKKVVNIPVIAVGRINSPFLAEEVLLSGKADMVTMGKASLADPYLPKKALAGETQDIRLCIGCMQGCTRSCTVNPRLGHESEYVMMPAEDKKKVFVVGGGVSGAEAAIAAAERGHKVVLFEQGEGLGGQWQLACMPPGKTDFATFACWQKYHLEKCGVEVRLNTVLTKEIVVKEAPEAIILATGSVPLILPIAGVDGANVVTAQDVLSGKAVKGSNVVIIGGGSVGAETAEYLTQYNKKVTLIEMAEAIAKDMPYRTRVYLMERLDKKNVKMFVKTKVTKIQDIVYAQGEYGEIAFENVDTVVLASGVKKREIQADFLDGYQGKVVSCGDAAALKDGQQNIHEGFKVGYYI